MTITLYKVVSAIKTGVQDDIVISVTGIYGSNVVICASYGERNSTGNGTPSNVFPTLNALGNMERGYSGQTNAWEEAQGTRGGAMGIFWEPVGDVSNFTATVTYNCTGTGSNPGLAMTIFVLRGTGQSTTALPRARDNPSGSDNLTTTVTPGAHGTDDAAVTMAMNVDHAKVPTTSTSDVIQSITDQPDSGNGGELKLATAINLPAGTSPHTTTYTYDIICSNGSISSVLRVAATTAAVIFSVDGDEDEAGTVDTADTSLPVIGTDLDQFAGTETLYIGDDPDFASATLVAQNISSITSTTFTWDDVDLGAIPAGDLQLFLVTDEGGGNEDVSPPFFITITDSGGPAGDEEGAADDGGWS